MTMPTTRAWADHTSGGTGVNVAVAGLATGTRGNEPIHTSPPSAAATRVGTTR